MSSEQIDERDRALLRRAFEEARQAGERGLLPFGAVVADASGSVLGVGHNDVLGGGTWLGHAELNALRASEADGADLGSATIYSSAAPCPMCAGAIYWSGVRRVVFGLGVDVVVARTGGPDSPAVRFDCRELLSRAPASIEVIGPVLEAEAEAGLAGLWPKPRMQRSGG